MGSLSFSGLILFPSVGASLGLVGIYFKFRQGMYVCLVCLYQYFLLQRQNLILKVECSLNVLVARENDYISSSNPRSPKSFSSPMKEVSVSQNPLKCLSKLVKEWVKIGANQTIFVLNIYFVDNLCRHKCDRKHL